MATVPTTAVSTYNDSTSDTAIFASAPLLTKGGRVDARLTGSTLTTVGSDTSDAFIIDVAGGSHDSSGSLSNSENLVISYQVDSPGTISLQAGVASYSDISTFNSTGSPTQSFGHLSGSGTVIFNSSNWSSKSGDKAIVLIVGDDNVPSGGNNGQGYKGTYHLNFSVGGSPTPNPTPTPTPTPTPPAPPSDNGDGNRFAFNGHSYQYVSFNGAALSWDQANAMAIALGGYLATITSQGENDFITNNVISGHLTAGLSGALFGLTDAGHEGAWLWGAGPEAGSGSPFGNWAPGEPNGGTGENYGLFGADGRWVDVAAVRDAAWTTGFIVEYPTATGPGGGHGVGDFNKNGMSDLVWYNQNTSGIETWLLNNGKWAGSVDIGKHPAGYIPAGTGDFNKDGTADLFWFNPSTRDTDIWLLNNGGWSASTTIGKHPAGGHVAGTADFNKDGTTDVLWFDPLTLATEIWLVNNGKWAATVDIGKHPAGYQIAGVGDFNKDGSPDILWFNPVTRDTDIWLLNNGKYAGSTTIGVHPPGYQIAGIGDFNMDGTSDVLWYNPTSHETDIWLLNNGKWAASTTIGLHPGNYQVGGVGDFNSDGTSDVLWVDPATNAVDVWLVANAQWAGSVNPGSHPAGWMVI